MAHTWRRWAGADSPAKPITSKPPRPARDTWGNSWPARATAHAATTAASTASGVAVARAESERQEPSLCTILLKRSVGADGVAGGA